MIAATVLAIVVVVIVSSFTSTLASIERAREQAELSQMARLVMERMFSDLTSTFFISEDESYQFVSQDEETEQARGPTLSFITVASRSVLGGTLLGGLARVEYFLGPHPDDAEEMALYRREANLLAGTAAGSGKVALLGERVRDFHVEYYDADGTSHSAWDSADAEGERSLPVAVRITLVLGRTDPGQVFTTLVPIP